MLALRTAIRAISGLGSCFNFLIIPIIYFASSEHIGKYKYLMIAYALSQASFSTSEFILAPFFMLNEREYVFYATDETLPRWFTLSIVLPCWTGGFITTVILLAVQFVYRYGSMCRPKILIWYKEPKRILILASGVLFAAVILDLAVIFGMPPCKETDDYLRDDIFNATGLEISKLSYFGAQIWKNGRIVVGPAVVLMICTIFVSASMSVAVYCAFKIFHEFETYKQIVSKTAFQYHVRLYTVLVIQTIIPAVFMLIPAGMSYLFALFSIDTKDYAKCLSSLLIIAPVIDPIMTATIITDYRRAILGIFCKSYRRSKLGTVNDSTGIQSNNRNLGSLEKARAGPNPVRNIAYIA